MKHNLKFLLAKPRKIEQFFQNEIRDKLSNNLLEAFEFFFLVIHLVHRII